MCPDSVKQIVVIGGLSAGPSAAARARRIDPNAGILMFEKGNDISYATCGIPYVLSGSIASAETLNVVSAALLETRFNIEVHLDEEVLAIDTKAKTIQTKKGILPLRCLNFRGRCRTHYPSIARIRQR